MEAPLSLFRVLQENDVVNNTSSSPSLSPTVDQNAGSATVELTAPSNEGKILRDTFLVYGSVMAGVLLFFCFIRLYAKRPYTIRQWVESIKVRILK
jgi:hypothetical protein